MKLKTKQNWLLTLMALALLFTLPTKAQVTVGDQKKAQDFSILELSTEKLKGGLRLAQLTTHQRDSISNKWKVEAVADKLEGLVIYNLDTNCVDYWNGNIWITLCADNLIPPLGVIVSPPSTIEELGRTVKLTATVSPTNATNVKYKWEFSYDGNNWTIVDGETNKTLDVEVTSINAVRYRVIAYNSAGSVTSNEASIEGIMFSGPGDNPNIQMYIGAFWKASQKGERIIQFGVGNGLNNSGEWIASVIWYDGEWDPYNSTSPDGVVLANNANPVSLPLSTDAEANPVIDGSRVIKGTVADGGTISFRIGLNKTFTNASKPARYAVVMLTLNNDTKRYKLFIRQGERDDYVMRPYDSVTGVSTDRPAAMLFSPYNLQDPQGRTPNDYDNAASLVTNGARFTDYPTQAGYFFVYNDRKAFAADVPTGSISAWNQNVGIHGTDYWNASWEVCPAGYRRPTDGANPTTAQGTGTIAGSEIRQSLWQNPPTGTGSNVENSTWGYYADGYFDRMVKATSRGSNSSQFSAVATGSIQVAYAGRLFFNPITNASLFFPATGYRIFNLGELTYSGSRARYWTSTSHAQLTGSAGDAWYLYFYSSTSGDSAGMHYEDAANDYSKASGAVVRCVKNSPQ